MQSKSENSPRDRNQPASDPPPPKQASDFEATRLASGDTSREHATVRDDSTRIPPESRVGTRIGRYKIVEFLGQGGMGTVFRAWDPMIQRDVAIKLLPEELSRSETAVQRFLVEARSAGRLNHPNAVAIYEIGQEGTSHYLVMEYVPGRSIDEAVRQTGPLSAVEASRVAADACRGLAAAHAVGLIHRDVKPANLLRADDGTVKVADFGLAKIREMGTPTITDPNNVMGTPNFMSPEQCESGTVDGRSDIYSLGATYYSLLTGIDPYSESGSLLKIMFAHCNADIPDPRREIPQIPEACAQIIARAMAKAPDDRYQTAEEMLADLQAAASGRASLSKPSLSPPKSLRRLGSALRRKRWPIAIAASIVGVVALAAVAVLLPPIFRNGRHESVVPEPIPPESLAQGVTNETITLGTTTAYSGPSRDLGLNMVLGIRACFNAVNDAGGIHGRKLELIVLDDGYEPDRALANMKELFEKRKVFAVIGNVGTPTAEVTVPYALEHRYLFFAPFSGAALLRQDPPDRYVFNYRASYADETAAMVRYFVDIKGIPADKIAVFAQNDSYGDDGFHGVVHALRKYGVKESEILRINYDRNTVQVADAVEQFAKQRERFQAIIMVPTYAVAARFIQQMRMGDPQVQFGIVSFVGSGLLAEELLAIGPEYCKDVIVTQVVPHFLSNATGVIRYREQLARYFPEAQPGFVSLEGFIAAECLVEGLKRTGPNLTTEGLIDSLESIHNLDLGIGPIIDFGPSKHQASAKVWGTILDDSGEFHTLELE